MDLHWADEMTAARHTTRCMSQSAPQRPRPKINRDGCLCHSFFSGVLASWMRTEGSEPAVAAEWEPVLGCNRSPRGSNKAIATRNGVSDRGSRMRSFEQKRTRSPPPRDGRGKSG